MNLEEAIKQQDKIHAQLEAEIEEGRIAEAEYWREVFYPWCMNYLRDDDDTIRCSVCKRVLRTVRVEE